MTRRIFYRIGRITVLDVDGADALTIVHNLTTNEVRSLELGCGRETFVTDPRGKTLAHVYLYREQGGLRMIGPAGVSEKLAAHIDRYTIREDAVPTIRDDEFQAIVLPRETAETVCGAAIDSGPLSKSSCRIGGADVDVYVTRWLGEATAVLLPPSESADEIAQQLASQSIEAADEAGFHQQRVRCGFPWYGIDLDETNLPQEAARNSLAISFTKGCYLGQETVARLDALGQVQKKLVRWVIADAVPEPGASLECEGKTVGRLTSVTADEGTGAIAIGFARRTHFEPGATATGKIEATGVEFTAVVT